MCLPTIVLNCQKVFFFYEIELIIKAIQRNDIINT